MRSVLRSTSLGLLVLLLALLVPALVPSLAHADTPAGVTCSMVNGVRVCTDNSTGSTGSYCVVDQVTQQQACLTNGGSQTVGRIQMGQGLGSVLGLPSKASGTGWLSKLTGWFAYAIHQIFVALAALLHDLVPYLIGAVLDLVAFIVDQISPPDFLSQYSLNTLLGNAGPIVGFFVAQFKVGQALTLIGYGYGFRLLRKFLTLFQW